jgi:hypothetical protein
VSLPELTVLGDPSAVAARLRVDRWELKVRARRSAGGSAVTCDGRGRVLVPLGVRSALDLRDAVVVSVSADSSTVVIWPAAALDRLLEVPA